MERSIRIGFVGDVMLGRNVDERASGRPADAVWGDLRDRLAALDALAINLECALSTRGRRWTRTRRPFHFRADPDWAIPALSAVDVSFAALANNHVLDFEEPALLDTLSALDEAGIARAGAGRDVEEAFAPATIEADGLRAAFVSLTDNTPEYAAGPDDPGTARVPIEDEPAVARERAAAAIADARAAEPEPDLLVASLHWGPNMVEEPPEAFGEFARHLVEAGVDLIHGHSAHVFQGIEVIDGAPVCYDCGDFVDDYAVDPRLRNDRSFLFEARVDPATGDVASLRLLPVEIDDCAVRRASDETANWARERMRERSAPFGTTFDRDGEELVLEAG